ncbi:LamG-like jellyroll fold domain-containing protein [Pedobacter caeni]|uniref:Gliding motility-associated C-terminal domain-containing protein n=1 Tax=Pedobacter caeni TaxID=288992 RepID=A0A1M5JKL6_9SPHI|nr:LamG-like jellyroll fold domain-containing protein [Pedobacter caeni]SHG41126.1 gliding motility-associated C-terminal domain-containing protein [Pedobacter caeni]
MKKILLFLWGILVPSILAAQIKKPAEKDFRILNTNKEFKPEKGFESDQKTILLDQKKGRMKYNKGQYFLVQFEELPDAAKKQKLKDLGIRLLDYVPNYSYYAHFKKELNSEQFPALGIRTVLPIDEGFKLSESLFRDKIPQHARKGNEIEVEVVFYDEADLALAETDILKAGSIQSKGKSWIIRIAQNKLKRLAAIKEIKFISPVEDKPKPEVDGPGDIFSNNIGRSNYINSGYNGMNYNGAGVNVHIRENDFLQDIDMQGRMIPGSVNVNPGGHSWSVSKRMGSAGNYDPKDQSNAWGSNFYVVSGQNTYTNYDDPNKKIRVTNMSYGWGADANYGSLSNEHDNYIRTRPEAMLVYSSGNSGDIVPIGGKYNGIPGWGNLTGSAKHAKNLLTISGTDYDDNFLDWTNKGPAYDGRIKPDMTIEGSGGTSYAAPKVSGIFAMLHQAYKAETQAATAPSALIKAILLNTADDIYNPGIDFKTGFGRPNVRRAFKTIQGRNFSTGQLANGESKNTTIDVPAGTSQVRIMLYWHDYEATPGAAKSLVNDLDLSVTDPSANTFLPWGLDTAANAVSLNSLPTRKVDHINNVEQVTIDNPVAGTYTLNLNGSLIPQGPQEYYIVYEFVKDEVLMAYPLGGESMGPGKSEYIRWDAYGVPGTFNLDYSADNGTTWTSIASNIAASKRQFKWTVPNLSSKIKIRVKRAAQESVVNDVNVLAAPEGLEVVWAGSSSLQLSWRKSGTAVQYEVFKLGEKYMESAGLTSDTTLVLNASDPGKQEWYAVRSIGANGLQGLRSNSIPKETGLQNFKNLITGTAFNIRKNGALLTGKVNALGGTLTNVVFEYGPTIAYGSQTNVPGSFSGANLNVVQQEVPFAMKSGEVWHYRLKASANGTDVFGEDHTFQPAPGSSVAFSGTGTEFITLGNNSAINGTKARTIELWAKADAFNDGGVFATGITGTNLGEFSLRTTTTDNLWRANFWNSSKDFTLPNSKGEWHHYALVFDGTNISFYYDGEQKLAPTPLALNTTNGLVRLGLWNSGPSNKYFKGEIDEVKVWSRALSSFEIKQGFHHPVQGNEAGLVYYTNFDNSEPEVYDIVSKKEVTLTGTPLRIKTAYPFGGGVSQAKSEVAGSSVYGNGVNVTAFYNAVTPVIAGFSKIDFSSPAFNDFSPSAVKIGNEYWVGNRFNTNANLNMNLTFSSTEDLTAADQLNPEKILVMSRPAYGSAKWQFSGPASAVDEVNNTITVNNLNAYSQYFFIKDSTPFLLSNVDSLVFSDARAGSKTRAESFLLSGTNLSATAIQVKAPEGYELSLDNLSFVDAGSFLTLNPVNGTVKDVKIYARFSPSAAQQYTGTIKISAGTQLLSEVKLNQKGIKADVIAGKAMSFDGNGDYLEIQELNWQPKVFTIEWWHKAKSFKNYNQSIGNGWGSFLLHSDNTGGVNIGVANNAASRLLITDAFKDVNTWHHYAYTFNNGVAKIYRDGKLADSKTASSLPPMWNSFRIGSSDGNSIDGEIEEFRMWSVEKTQQQVREGMHLTSVGNEPGLKVYLQFQDAATGVSELSDNGYKVTLNGNATRVISNAPVAAGISESKQITAAGTSDFPIAGLSLQFSESGTNPNGEVVVSRLRSIPNENTVPSVLDSTYWVINNYGSNLAPTGLTGLSLKNVQSGSSAQSLYRLNSRAFNAFGPAWNSFASMVGPMSDPLSFSISPTGTGISFGQLALHKIGDFEPVETLAGKAYQFDGTAGMMKITGLNWKPTAFTVEYWLNPASAKSWNQSVGNGWGSFLIHADSDNILNLGVANNTASRISVPGVFNTLNVWHHIAFTYDNGLAKCYVDGQLSGSKPASTAPPLWDSFNIGSMDGNTLDGKMDEFRIWSTARTAQEIQENMHLTLSGNESGLKVYLQGQGNAGAGQLIDVSPNHYIVEATGNVQRDISSAPVANGISQTLVVNAAGKYDFDLTGLALNYGSTGTYPKGNVVISKLNSLPFSPVENTTSLDSKYWIIRNYGDAEASAIESAELSGVANSSINLSLYKRAFNQNGGWNTRSIGASQTGFTSFTAGTTDFRNSQVMIDSKANSAPAIAFSAPANNANYKTTDSIKITGMASDPDGNAPLVELYNGAAKLISLAGSSAFSYTLEPLPAGTYQLVAKAVDNAGLVATDTVSISVKTNVLPVVALISPEQNTSYDTAQPILIQSEATDSDGTIALVEFYDGAVKIGESTTAPFQMSWTGATVGVHQLTAKAKDNNGGESSSAVLTLEIVPVNMAPAIAIVSPENGSLFNPNKKVSITAQATDADGSVAKVEFFERSAKIASILTAPYTFKWQPKDAGTYYISAIATDNKGLTTTSGTIIINLEKKKDAIQASNIITPNGDGRNDKWIIEDISNFPNNKVSIFTKTGQIVFSTRSYSNDSNYWEGLFNGSPLREDTYFYSIDLGTNKPYTGFITLIR